jgi:hypothetical protein
MAAVAAAAAPDASMIFSVSHDDALDDAAMRVTVWGAATRG